MADSKSAHKPDPVTGERSKSTSGSSKNAINSDAKNHTIAGTEYDVFFHVEPYDPLQHEEEALKYQEEVAQRITDHELEMEGESPLLMEARRAARDRSEGISQSTGAFTASAPARRSTVPADIGGRYPGLVPRAPRTDDDRIVKCGCGWFTTFRQVSGIGSVRGLIRDHMFEAHLNAMADTPEMRAAVQARDEADKSRAASDEKVARARTEAAVSSDAPPVSQRLAAEKQAEKEAKAEHEEKRKLEAEQKAKARLGQPQKTQQG